MARKHHREHSAAPGPSQRALRVGELIRHAMADMLTRGDVHDPVLEGHLITVPEVRMTADLRLATIYIMPLGGDRAQEIVEALNRHQRFIRGRIAPELDLKFAPELRFFVDETFEQFGKIDSLLKSDRVQRDLNAEDEDDKDSD